LLWERSGTYHICADRSILPKIEAYRDRMTDAGWRGVYDDMLGNMCRARP